MTGYAGYDPTEKPWDEAREKIHKRALAIAASVASRNRVRRWRDAARFDPPRAAPSGFPYPHMTCDQWFHEWPGPRTSASKGNGNG